MGIVYLEIYKKKESLLKKFEIGDFVITERSRIYKFIGNIKRENLTYIAEKLLLDPVIEEFNIGIKKSDSENNFLVFLKENVLDVEGERVKELLGFLKIKGIKDVKSGKKFSILGKKNKKEILQVLSRNVYNPVIEEVKFL